MRPSKIGGAVDRARVQPSVHPGLVTKTLVDGMMGRLVGFSVPSYMACVLEALGRRRAPAGEQLQ
jgi:hypothetical protein